MLAFRRNQQLRGVVDDLLNNINPLQSSVDDACRQIASANMLSNDQDISDVEDNWHPTGFYTPQQVRDILLLGVNVQNKARDCLDAGVLKLQIPAHRAILDAARDDIDDSSLDPGAFIKGANEAEAAGPKGIVEATGLKRWVIAILKAARAARMAAEIVECARPGLLFDVVSALDSARNALVQFVTAVVAVVKTAASIVAKVPDLLGTLFTVIKVVPWVVLVAGGYYAGIKTGLIPSRFDPLELRHRETLRPWRRI